MNTFKRASTFELSNNTKVYKEIRGKMMIFLVLLLTLYMECMCALAHSTVHTEIHTRRKTHRKKYT